MEIEKEAIRRDGDTVKETRYPRELAELQAKKDELKAAWKGEKEMIEKVQEKKEEVESLRFEAEQAERKGDYGRVAEIRYGKIIGTGEGDC